MGKFLPFVLTLCLLLISCVKPHLSVLTVPVSMSVSSSIIRLHGVDRDFTTEYSVCTAFSVRPPERWSHRNTFLTAAHCIHTKLLNLETDEIVEFDIRDGFLPVRVLDVNECLDVALIEIPERVPPLALRAAPLAINEVVQALGFGGGVWHATLTNHLVLATEVDLKMPNLPLLTVFMFPFIEGMSGGPVFDEQGEVVGMVQLATSQHGFGVSAQQLEGFLEGHAINSCRME